MYHCRPLTTALHAMQVVRFITPYGRNMSKYIDITPLANSLHGSVLGVFIDTWSVPPLSLRAAVDDCHAVTGLPHQPNTS